MLLHSPAQLNYKPVRIVSLVPSQTELLFYLGLDKAVVGITKFCVHPAEWKRSKSIVGGTKNINLKKIKDCDPDLIIANKEENVKEQIEALAEEYNVWVTDVSNLADSFQMIADIGILTQTVQEAEELIREIATAFKNLQPSPQKLKTCYLIWRNPYMTIGGDTFISDMMERCGFENLYAGENRYPQVDMNELKEKGCELLLLSSEPYPFKQKHAEALQLLLPNTKIMLVDGEMFSWYGSRLLQASSYFAKLISNV